MLRFQITLYIQYVSSFKYGECGKHLLSSVCDMKHYTLRILTHVLTHTYIYTNHNNYYTLPLSLYFRLSYFPLISSYGLRVAIKN